MPDLQLPQIPSAPTPAKSAPCAARGAETKAESQSDQGFSNVLKAQMRPENEAEQVDAEAQDTGVESASSELSAVVADGKQLPPGGNVTAPALAALDPLLAGGDAVAQDEAVAVEASVEPALLLPGLPIETPAESHAQSKAATAQRQSGAADTWLLRAGPWQTGAAELPDAAQTAVAQAVRSAVAEVDETVQSQLALERFGADVRTVATAQSRAPGMESLLERLTGSATQPAAPAGNAVAQGLQALTPQDAASARPALPTTSVETPLRQPGWGQDLSERVLWVANQKFQGAEIKLNPAHLGPIEVRVQLHNDQAQISFTAQHGPAREALEAALPRLREMFTANGYNLVDVDVSQHSFAEQQRQAQGFEGRGFDAAHIQEGGEAESTLPSEMVRLTGLPSSAIDLFA